MRDFPLTRLGILAAAAVLIGASAHATDRDPREALKGIVDEAIRPVMAEHKIPGLAVAITAEGERYVFNYGVASKESGQAVTDRTLFEIGSISKTFTATLAAYAQESGSLSLSDPAGKYLPALAGSSFDAISLLDLGTYTAGGLPLQFPNSVTDENVIAYFKKWHPEYAPGTYRRYSNPSIGLFGHLAAQSMGKPFEDLMEGELVPMLGLSRTHIRVPEDRMADYAHGYSRDGRPVRVTPGVLDWEAYGIKTTAFDLIRFVEANIGGAKLDGTLQRAITATHTGYYRVGEMVQGLGWEMYPYPTELERLLAGNSRQMAFEPNKATKLTPPLPPRGDMLINKTGSTNGFGAYAAFIPAKEIGIVILANRSYPIPARVKAAYRILTELDKLTDPR
ncbi:Beta-lactamase [Sinorhizobium sojae CCBAU 05684]|uniref:Beta-lactamase n=1 Tax=Sinorhizobium sojae CCBAU 05684 TaxID=716928 RepID=A0A249PBX0_9HYPH|nr:class C beta-lactamase [Sinorhizobium sojae]ASY63207.1 Beta-lactamase [Sinorhizobium sojae CCBAU 05684]